MLDFNLKHIPAKKNPVALIIRGCSVAILRGSIWERGPEWLVTPYSSQAEINAVAPVKPQVDLSQFSTFIKA